MKYEDMRHTIKSGDILAFSHEGWDSFYKFKIQMVRMFTKSEYSHVGVAWVIGERVFVIEAVVPCVRIFPLTKCGNFYHIPMGIEWNDTIEEKALTHIGNPYSQITAMKAFFHKLNKGNTEECAALVLTIMDSAGVFLDCRATPDDVVEYAQLRGSPLYLVENN